MEHRYHKRGGHLLAPNHTIGQNIPERERYQFKNKEYQFPTAPHNIFVKKSVLYFVQGQSKKQKF